MAWRLFYRDPIPVSTKGKSWAKILDFRYMREFVKFNEKNGKKEGKRASGKKGDGLSSLRIE